jgi:nucleoside-diphosphate-sugar epimerase
VEAARPSRARMKVLVTGATGYLGRAVVRQLRDTHEVTEAARQGSFAVDLDDADLSRAALEDFRWDAVIHLAGPAVKGVPNWDHTVALARGHVKMTQHVLAWIPPAWPGRFIHVSGAIVYGTPREDPVDESHPRSPLHGYALAKCLTEDLVLGSRLHDRWVLRMGGLFSSDRRAGALFAFAQNADAGEPLRITSSTPVVPWEIIHVDDAAFMIARALEAQFQDPGPVNIGYGERIQIEAIAKHFADRSGKGSRVVLEGESPPPFRMSVQRMRSCIGRLPRTLGERLDELQDGYR